MLTWQKDGRTGILAQSAPNFGPMVCSSLHSQTHYYCYSLWEILTTINPLIVLGNYHTRRRYQPALSLAGPCRGFAQQ